MRVIAWIAVVAGCGRIAFDARSADGGPDDGSGEPADAPCALGPWSTPVLIPALSSGADDHEPALHPDGSLLVYMQGMQGTVRLWAATHAGGTFGTPFPLVDLQETDELGPAWSPAGDELNFVTTRTGNARLFVSAYSGGAFAPPTQVDSLASEDVNGPVIRSDGLELYYSTTAGVMRRAERASTTDPWVVTGDEPQLTVGGMPVGYATLTTDGRTMYYEVGTPGGSLLYEATRATLADRFASPTPVPELSALAGFIAFADPELSRDGRTLLLSALTDQAPTFDMYISTRSCE